ncbi:zinc transporter ZntB [Pelobacter seleniigenes]|uniref:zinc transporter ZntB n=1 Tax=Pelobacter seleniigenes TaxID=407188 RepID=UPI0004A75879|nr:zinc transporter ZntB [Pelobacter seleniigenes]
MESALVSAYLLLGNGYGKALDATAAQAWAAEQGALWLHLDYTAVESHSWLRQQSGIDPLVLEAFLAEDTRPRCFSHPAGLLVILRGVNLNPGAEPDDMVSIRLWIEANRVISIRHRKLMAIEDIRSRLEQGNGPENCGDFLVQLSNGLAWRMADVLETMEDAVDELEDEVLERGTYELRGKLSAIRRQIIRLRRYLAPQREVMNRLQTEKNVILDEFDKAKLRETADQITRYVEDLDSAKDRAAVCQEELESRMGAQMNKTLYILSIITAVFLPLGLLTGLLGINVGGIPGSDNPLAFLLVCLLLLVIVVIQLLIFRRIRWV